MKTPSSRQFKKFFDRLPRWVIPLILILLFGRFLITLLFLIFSE
jgi:hypothetical protein